MKPTFKTVLAWEQAQLLMQPALIRVVDNLRKHLEESSWQGRYEETQIPVPGYQLCLTQGDRCVVLDIWQLCFQVCFIDYPHIGEQNAISDSDDYPVDIDTRLVDEAGEVDWQQLEQKTQQLVSTLFAQLPPTENP